ncbi:extracellular solute-binding protein [Consotaella salsifontis]|uniref:Peptide/nickel transport system substrate-binding protein n=1 Tax=Consotaella salsifontis TaxID=1365950 RepID=A0A1T4SZ14_9HYPH|nr:extracellular solute-binding protein [Consotaella salsifontis]SKA33379.1 peptide/nickel transport system substrate-binding protein [Consotaella salsifontis]
MIRQLSKTARALLALAALAALGAAGTPNEAGATPSHGIAMQGEPELPADFDHFPYANPDAPQGGRMIYGVFGTFDNLNPITVKSSLTTARGIWADPEFGSLVFESLLQRSADEPFTLYGLLAESVETDPDRSFVEFTLNPKAKFSDGTPVTVEDVLYTSEMLKDHGRPFYGIRLKKVAKIEKVGERGVRFTFNDQADRELPLLLAMMPILPKHAFPPEAFDETTLRPVIGSGPYVIANVQPGQSILYRKDPNYWGKDLPVKRGIDNYDEIRIDYFRDINTQFEAFKKGLFYVYLEGNPRHWQTAYDFPAVADGDVIKEAFKTQIPAPIRAFVFNTRRPVFSDVRVRRALSLLFDFEWANKNLYYGAYQRISGFFDNSELSSIGRPASEAEKGLLGDALKEVDRDVLAGTYHAPVSDGSGTDRALLRQAMEELKKAGYSFEGGKLVSPEGQPLAFEIMAQSADEERLALAYARTLARLGITATVRQVDDSQYQARKQAFDYDMLLFTYTSSLSPGAEQVNRWGSQSRDATGSFNYAGVADPAVDALIERIVKARDREEFVDAVRAYDRLLISGYYVVPLFYLPDKWLARWSFLKHPDETPVTGYYLPAFWLDPKKGGQAAGQR